MQISKEHHGLTPSIKEVLKLRSSPLITIRLPSTLATSVTLIIASESKTVQTETVQYDDLNSLTKNQNPHKLLLSKLSSQKASQLSLEQKLNQQYQN